MLFENLGMHIIPLDEQYALYLRTNEQLWSQHLLAKLGLYKNSRKFATNYVHLSERDFKMEFW
jgi:hypothetical protein